MIRRILFLSFDPLLCSSFSQMRSCHVLLSLEPTLLLVTSCRLLAFVVILALANLGTSFASAILAQDTKTNNGKLVDKNTNEAVATANAVETYAVGEDDGDYERRLVECQSTTITDCNATATVTSKTTKSMSTANALAMLKNCKENKNVQFQLMSNNGGTVTQQMVCGAALCSGSSFSLVNDVPTSGDLCVPWSTTTKLLVRPNSKDSSTYILVLISSITYSSQTIDCVNGEVASGLLCKDACGGQCCKDPNNANNDPCASFTGKVGKDGKSCMGYNACTFGRIKSVTDSCSGREACFRTGYNGTVSDLTNACMGENACTYAGTSGGAVGKLTNACNGTQACRQAGTSGGAVGDLTNCCSGDSACFNFKNDANFPAGCKPFPITASPSSKPTSSKPSPSSKPTSSKPTSSKPTIKQFNSSLYIDCVNGKVASGLSCKTACGGQCCVPDLNYASNDPCGYFTGKVRKDGKSCMGSNACNGGNMKSVTNSCNGKLACSDAGYSGAVGHLTNACYGENSCASAGQYGGIFGDLTDACIGRAACFFLGYNGGTVGDLTNACTGEYACKQAGEQGGAVGHLTNACNGRLACRYAGAWSGGGVGALTNACNGTEACDYAGFAEGVVGNLKNCCSGNRACYSIRKDANFPAGCRTAT